MNIALNRRFKPVVNTLDQSTNPSTLFAFGINHKSAPVEVRERLFLTETEIRSFLSLVEDDLEECLVVSTCNRTEIYGVTESPDFNLQYFKDLLIDFKNARGFVRDEHFFELISCSACQQLFSVVTSIDSQVVGDLQILPQVRGSYSIAQTEGMTGKILNQLLQRAFKLGKQTFTETSIHHGAVSVSLAAVELAISVFGSLEKKSVLVLGAGETARLTAEALLNKRVGKLIVANRTRSHAEELLASLDCGQSKTAVEDFDDFQSHIDAVDIVITSTGSELPIIRRDDLSQRTRPLLIVDIAVPRDVEPEVGELPNVTLKNIDTLLEIVSGNRERRTKDLPVVKKLIANEMLDFLMWYYTLPLLPVSDEFGKPSDERKCEILRIKKFLNDNISEIHKLYNGSNGNFQDDLQSHLSLVNRLQTMKVEAFG